MKPSPGRAVAAFLAIAFWVLPKGFVHALPEEAETCLACHSRAGGAPATTLAGFDASAHKGLECASCHGGAAEAPHAALPPPVDCGACHASAARGIKISPHGHAVSAGAGKKPAGACLVCHGKAHAIAKVSSSRSPASRSRQVGLCASCHQDPAKTPSHLSRLRPVSTYAKTVHGLKAAEGNAKAALCGDCHGTHDIRPGIDPASRVSRNRIAETCGRCHESESTAYSSGVHGRARAEGTKEAPTCTDCHGEHDVVSVNSPRSHVSSGTIVATCSGCHASERIIGKFGLPAGQVTSFNDSYHGLAASRGLTRAANCASCHGWHEILPSSDPASSIHPNNLAKTCGTCHPGAGLSMGGGGSVHSHLSKSASNGNPASFFRLFYLVLIPLLVGGMLLHNLIDLARHGLGGPRASLKEDQGGVLLNASERAQHAVLAVSFLALAYTGFALEYPNLWWTAPAGSEEFRRWIHRAAAAALVLIGLYHACYLAFAAAGRERLAALLPARRDLIDPLRVIAYNLRLSRRLPLLARFSYIEKAEYWALAWGALVMVATGAVLAFNRFSLAHFPLWVIETARVIHLMEAVLACLAIVVWHFYWVIFDPEVYPMNWAWLTGESEWRPLKAPPRSADPESPREK
ncbi:MAG: hypothetical protein HY403_05870 [Elusimicrobia bacterium]|nr:hypothetical protein [Elusimicrobiota bacterium]